ncbi:hypothetical protein ACFOY2_38345 [Nonomuraea purpurea]|uniref:Uncharacterized protein n=1 Tax=Nonomuraea purpurea TaxID=1849276 RepID=A0ABV8GJF0_9ACTN
MEQFLSEMVFPGETWVVPVTRRIVAAILSGAGHQDVDNAQLIVSELISNASAPRGALLYPRLSREELKGGSWA